MYQFVAINRCLLSPSVAACIRFPLFDRIMYLDMNPFFDEITELKICNTSGKNQTIRCSN